MSKQATTNTNNGISGFIKRNLLRASTALTVAGTLVLTSTSASAAPADSALPTGFSLQAGTVGAPVITGPGSGPTMTLTQSTNRAVINWNTFNIGKKATVSFNQTQGNQSITVNRVLNAQNDPSQIYGQLKANGRVMILDKNGVLFGSTAKIDVGGLIASTGNLADQTAFMSGANQFVLSGVNTNPNAKIENLSDDINIKDSGLLAFVAPYIDNNGGTITAKLGKVSLASASKVTVDLTGDELITFAAGDTLQKALIKNSDAIEAQGGYVNLSTNVAKGVIDEVINMSGVVKANSYQQVNGKIVLSGGGGKVKVSGDLMAQRDSTSGNANAGGSVTVKGVDVEVTSSGDINTNYTGLTGNGGNVYIWAEDKVIFAGEIDASAGSKNGNGGSVEIAGDNTLSYTGDTDVSAGSQSGNGGNVKLTADASLTYRGSVNASADHGTRGTLTIDPAVVTIGNSMFDPIVNAGALAETLGLSNVHIVAGDKIILVDAVDLSHWGFGGLVTSGDLELTAPTVDLLKTLKIGSGDLTVDADTVNLGGKLYRNTSHSNSSLFNVLLGRNDLDGHASVVNVLGDTASIQQGIHLAGSGSTVNVAWGNYGENINIYKSLTLKGDGSKPILFGTNSVGEIILVTANNVTVDGFSIDGSHAPWYVPHLYGIKAQNVSGLSVLNNSIGQFFGAGVSITGGAGHTVAGNDIFSTATAIRLTDVYGVNVSGNTLMDSVYDAIKAMGIEFSTIANNFISNSGGNGVSVEDAYGITIEGNEIHDSGENGIFVRLGDEIAILCNAITGSGSSHDEERHASHDDEQQDSAGGDGIHVEGGNDVDIMYNTISASADDGIDVSANISDDRNDDDHGGDDDDHDDDGHDDDGHDDNGHHYGHHHSPHYGYNDDGDDEGEDNEGGDDYNNGQVGSENIRIIGNNVSDSGDNGVETTDVSNLLIQNNDISDSGENGIMVDGGSSVRIDGNDVVNSGHDGIRAYNIQLGHVSEGYLSRFSEESEGGDDGYLAYNLEITNNRVNGYGDDGIDVSQSRNVLIGNNTVDTQTDDEGEYEYDMYAYGEGEDGKPDSNGIEVTNSDDVTIDGNDVSNSYLNGIFVGNSDDITISGNNVDNSGHEEFFSYGYGEYDYGWYENVGDGIHVQGSNNVDILHNEVDNSADDGIDVSSYAYEGSADAIERDDEGEDDDHHDHHDGEDDGDDEGEDEDDNFSFDSLTPVSLDDVSGGHNIRIIGNEVDDSGDNGIEASDISGLLIKKNDVSDSGDDGIYVTESNDVRIKKNDVYDSGDNGIAVWFSNDVRIKKNDVHDSGFNGILSIANDDVLVRGNDVHGGYGTGILVEETPFATIDGNDVSYFYNGITVRGGADVTIDDNDVAHVINDGIQAYNVGGFLIPTLSVQEGDSEEGDDAFVYDLRITNNRVSDYNDDGIQVAYSGNVLIGNNDVNPFGGGYGEGDEVLSRDSEEYVFERTGIRLGDNERRKGCGEQGRCDDRPFGIAEVSFPPGYGDFSGNDHVDVIGNTVSNNDVGLSARAFNNGYINLEGNVFTDNTIGAWIGSGLIDLTGESNTFAGGNVALRFERSSYDSYGYPSYEFSDFDGPYFDDESPLFETIYADLNLVGDTIGTTIFEGQSQYYIELLNGAFFDPGRPTIIDGRFASFDGFIPGTGPISPLKLKAIEDMINDYDDDRSLGQIFVGFSLNPFDDNDIMRRIFGGNFKGGRSGIVITGLPNTNGQGGGFSLQDLANIAPAAGGDDGEVGVEDLANLEPAAGGDDSNGNGVVDGKCWGNVGSLTGSAVVSMDLSEDNPSDILADQSDCGKGL